MFILNGVGNCYEQRNQIYRTFVDNIVKINLNFIKSHRIKHNLSTHTNIPTNFNITKVATSYQLIRGRCHFYGYLSCRYLWITPAKRQKTTTTNEWKTKNIEKHFCYCFTILFSPIKMSNYSWKVYKCWQSKMPKMVQNNPKQYRNLLNVIFDCIFGTDCTVHSVSGKTKKA